MDTLMISCRKATELTEKRIHFGLTIGEFVRWRMHTALCSACRRYSKQSVIIEKALERTVSSNSATPEVSDSDVQKVLKKILKE